MGGHFVGKREHQGEDQDNSEFDQLQVLQEREMILNNLMQNHLLYAMLFFGLNFVKINK